MSAAPKAGDFGWRAYHPGLPRQMRLKKPCATCPFVVDFIRPGRLDDIKFALSLGQPFWCHKTVYHPAVEWITDPETGEQERPPYDRRYRMCEGAARWLDARIAEQQEPTR